MVNYENSKIYTIRSHQTDMIYIGSTTQPLSKRLVGHKSKYKMYLNKKYNYVTSFEIIKYDDCYIELLENYPCDNKEQLHKIEGEYIRKLDCLNKVIPGRTKKQYREDNKDKINLRRKIKITCNICNCKIRKNDFRKHERTKKHKDNLDLLEKSSDSDE